MKYESVKQIMEDDNLSLPEIVETIDKFLGERGMTMDEFFYETEEGQKIQEESAEARFSMPTHEVKNSKEFKQK
ncbi:MAG: hypothetical protein IKC26_09555 [Clostridia bacterium]|nr:hypothetical protein [Clostridia bacterium]